MTDTDELRDLSLGYASAVDALDGDRLADLFTHDGELWVPDVAHGSGEPTICRSGTERLAGIPSGLARYHVTHHRVGPASLSVDGDAASGEVTGVAHHLSVLASAPADGSGGPGLDAIWYLRYVDDYLRGPTGWRIRRRALHLRWMEDRSVDDVGPGRPSRTTPADRGVRSGP
jgi:hypothetical protein